MDRILKHEVDEIRVWLHKLIQHLKVLQIAPLFLIEDIEIVFIRIELHVLVLLNEVGFSLRDLLITLLQLFLLFLQGSDLFINLFLHHLIKILLLNFQLFHYAAERFLKSVDFIIEFLPHFELKLGVEFFACRSLTFINFDLVDHFLHHTLHIDD